MPATLAAREEHQAKPRADFKIVFEANINAAFYGTVRYKSPNGREQVLVQIHRRSTEAAYHRNAQRRGWIKTILENHAGKEVEYEESDVWLLEEMHWIEPKHSKKWLHAKDSRFLTPIFLQIIRLQFGRTPELISVRPDRL